MSIFKNTEGEMARFDRHMKPIRALNENKRLRLQREGLQRELKIKSKLLKARKCEQERLLKELESFPPLQLELPLKPF
tara:strand:+ start:617 stop:850 length:234 start_codon:yes stop_codon:yes gene_type:complete